MSPKELVALAKACRKAGITHYRCGDIEFTLGAVNEAPQMANANAAHDVQGAVESDELTDDQLLNWSVMDIPQPDSTQ